MNTSSLGGGPMFADGVIDGETAEDRLGELGLTVQLLREPLIRGQRVYDEVTANHPKTAPGWFRWAETNRAVRDLLVPKGWSKEDLENLPRVVGPSGRFSFYATSGNDDTGLPHRIPSTRRPRGTAGARDVGDNAQLDIFPGDPKVRRGHRETWLLLYNHVTGPDDEFIRSELSLPSSVDANGRIIRWRERILLPDIDLLNEPMGRSENDVESDIEIPVQRKNA